MFLLFLALMLLCAAHTFTAMNQTALFFSSQGPAGSRPVLFCSTALQMTSPDEPGPGLFFCLYYGPTMPQIFRTYSIEGRTWALFLAWKRGTCWIGTPWVLPALPLASGSPFNLGGRGNRAHMLEICDSAPCLRVKKRPFTGSSVGLLLCLLGVKLLKSLFGGLVAFTLLCSNFLINGTLCILQ